MTEHNEIYRDYTASIYWSEQSQAYFGNVLGINHVIHFTGNTLDEAVNSFHESIDWYLDDPDLDVQVEKPPQEMLIPLPLQLYAKAHRNAETAGIPVAEYVQETMKQAMA